ncbi:hypothetical protein IIM_05093 [Bacillus cereus VD107]|nr:hypothetical protein IIM_05093 [Bacillus cereus VD107]
MSALKNSKIGTKLNTLMVTASIVWALLQSFLAGATLWKKERGESYMQYFKGKQFKKDIILVAVATTAVFL